MFKIFEVEDLFVEDGFGRLIQNPKYTSTYDDYSEETLLVEDGKGNLKANPKFENNKKSKESEREF